MLEMRMGAVYHLSYIAVIGFPLGRKMALCFDPQLLWKSASITAASKGHLPPVPFITNVQFADSTLRMPGIVLLLKPEDRFFAHPRWSTFVFCRARVVCEMAATPKGSAPGPVKLCVGECRPELRAQSSQLYSFVVSLKLKQITLVHLVKTNVCNEFGWAEFGKSQHLASSFQGVANKYSVDCTRKFIIILLLLFLN